MNNIFRFKHKNRQSGVALIEAMIALLLVASGLMAYLGMNAKVAGISAENRNTSFTILASEAAQEMLRNRPFNDIPASGNGTVQYRTSTLGGASLVAVTYCWTTTNVNVPGVTTNNLLSVITSATTAGVACDTADANNPARIQSLIARSNPKATARNASDSSAADGNGQVTSGFTPPPNTPVQPGGFQYVYDNNNKLVAVVSTISNLSLIPKNGDLLVATINGNIVTDHPLTPEEFNKYKIVIEGNAICNKINPNATASPANPPSVSRNGETISVFQYSCVVADGWRRSIAVAPPDNKKKVCVGSPEIQEISDQDPSVVRIDVLSAVGRQYFGKKYLNTVTKTPIVRSGMRGSATPINSQIGTICKDGDPCWNKAELKPWIPGGHHYFIINTDGVDPIPFCADRINEVFEKIDFNTGIDTGTRVSNYADFFYRNPHLVYCANTKDYSNDLYDLIAAVLSDADPTNNNQYSSECLSSTKLSGFIVPGTGVSLPFTTALGTSSDFDSPCGLAGPLGATGGAYFCSYRDLPSSAIDVTPLSPSLVFDPVKRGPFVSTAYQHDIVAQSFTVSAGAAPTSCPANANQSWTVSSNTCTGSLTSASIGGSQTLNDTVGTTGTATFVCQSNGTWQQQSGSTCAAAVTPPPTCPSQTMNWTASSNSCTGSIAQTDAGSSRTVTDSTTPTTGEATYACSATGTWSASPTSFTCITVTSPPATCTSPTIKGRRDNRTKVFLNSTECSYPKSTEYSCVSSSINTPTTYTLTYRASNNSLLSQQQWTITPPNCTLDVNLRN